MSREQLLERLRQIRELTREEGDALKILAHIRIKTTLLLLQLKDPVTLARMEKSLLLFLKRLGNTRLYRLDAEGSDTFYIVQEDKARKWKWWQRKHLITQERRQRR